MFVCRRNIYRSAVAEQLLKKYAEVVGISDRIETWSRGLQGHQDSGPPKFRNLTFYPEEWAGAKRMLDKLGVSLMDHTVTPISAADVSRADLVLAMDSDIHRDLNLYFPEAQDKIRVFGDIEDLRGLPSERKHNMIILRILEGIAVLLGALYRAD